jgi:hypothetical protein
MSKKMLLQLRCPNCGNIQDTIVWTSVNVTVNPELKSIPGDVSITGVLILIVQ